MRIKITHIPAICAIAFLALLPAFAASADESYHTSYMCRDIKGNDRWKADTTISAVDTKKDLYKLTEEGRGIYSGFDEPVSWKAEAVFISNESGITPVTADRAVFSPDGALLAKETQEFDLKKGKARYSYRSGSKRSITKAFDFSGDITNRLLLGLYIQKMLANGLREKTTWLLSSEPRIYRVRISIIDEETISLGGHDYKVFKICLDPQLGLLDIIKVFVPKAYVWHSSSNKFEWIKYKGLEESLQSPMVEIVTDERP